MKRYDVIVVGAGPAGSTTAQECATRGLDVLLLDKAVFPRDKPCGGGVNIRAARLLPFDIAPVTERTASAIRFSLRRSREFVLRSADALTYLTQRRRFDALLLEKSLAAGAVLREATTLRAVERHAVHVLVRAGQESFAGRIVVAADGANSATAKLAGIDRRCWNLVALEGNISLPQGGHPPWPDTLGVDLGDAPGGYGWIFPKGDHVNLGIIGWPEIGPTLRPRLHKLTRHYGFEPAKFYGLRGHYVPVRQSGSPVIHGSVLLVGDAAGCVDPFSGEGIYAAIWSGQAAARCILAYLKGDEADLASYQREMDETLWVEQTVSRWFYDLLHASPLACASYLRYIPGGWQAIRRIVRGELTYRGLKQEMGILAFGLELAARLARIPRLRHYRFSVSKQKSDKFNVIQ